MFIKDKYNTILTLHTVTQPRVCYFVKIFSARQHSICSARCTAIARPSVTRVNQSKTVEVRTVNMKFSPYGSLIPLVFAR